MSWFPTAIEVVLAHEGGFVNDPDDPGGATNWGVSLRWLAKQDPEIGDFDQDGDVDADDIRVMTREQAIMIYREYWWKKQGYDRIYHRGVAIKVFDLAVNMGPRQCHKLLQRSLQACGGHVVEDGILGPRTFAALEAANPFELLGALKANAGCFYRSLNRPKYLAGWLRRAYA